MSNLRKTYRYSLWPFHLHTTDAAAKALGWSENLSIISIQICWSNYLLLLSVLWNTAIWYGGHYLFLIKGKLKRFNVELQDYYHQLETDLIGRDSRYYSCHLYLAYRRLRGDMILLYKILNNDYFSSDFSALYTYPIITTITRAHQFKLFKYRLRLNCRSNYVLIH